MTATAAAGHDTADREPAAVPATEPRVEWRRQVLHLATAILAPLVWAPEPLGTTLLALGTVTAGAIDVARLRSPRRARRIDTLLPDVFRPDEARRLSGATLLLVGATVTSALFPPRAALAGFLCLAVGDAVAALAGQLGHRRRARRGGRPGGGKTLAGSLACGLVCAGLIAAVVGPRPLTVLLGSAVAALVERATPGRWDNLTLPVAVAAVVQATASAAV